MAEVISLVKDGDLDGVKRLLDKVGVKADPEEESGDSAMVRCDVFGKSYWSGGMSALLWAIEGSNLQIRTPSFTNYALPVHYGVALYSVLSLPH